MIRYVPLIGITLVALLLPGGVVHAENPMTFVVGLIMTVFLSIAGFFLWLSGELLSFVVTLTVLQAGKTMNLEVVQDVWTLFRSFGDILLLFILLFIGIGTILRWSQYEIKKLLPPLVIVALLLNFSIFFTKVIVDFTNIVAIEFYQAATGDGKFRVSEVIADELGIIKIYDESSFAQDKYSGAQLSASDLLVGGIMGIILFLISAGILFSSALTLVVRFTLLLFLMMLSPLAFVTYLAPATKKYATLWWSTFWQNAIFAPVFFMLLWASLWVMKGIDIFSVQEGINISTLNDSGVVDSAQVAGGVPTAAAILLNFMIVIAMLVASLIIANRVSKMGGNAVVKTANGFLRSAGMRAGRFTARAGFDMAARASRATVGASMEKIGTGIAQSRTLAGVATAENKNFVQRWAARQAINAGRSVEKTGRTASFNLQGVVERGVSQATGKTFSLDANEAATKLRQRGREQRAKDRSEEDAAWATNLKLSKARGVSAWSEIELKRLNADIEKYEKQVDDAETKVNEAEAQLQSEKAKPDNKEKIDEAQRALARAKGERQTAKNEVARLGKEKKSVEELVNKSATNIFDEPATLADKALAEMYEKNGNQIDEASKALDDIAKNIKAPQAIVKRYKDQQSAMEKTAKDLRRQHEVAKDRGDEFGVRQIDKLIADNGKKLLSLKESMLKTDGEYAKAAAEQAKLEASRATQLATIASYNDQVKMHIEAIKAGMKEAGKQYLETQKALAVDRLKSPESLVSYTSWARDPKHYRAALDEQIKKHYPKKAPKKEGEK